MTSVEWREFPDAGSFAMRTAEEVGGIIRSTYEKRGHTTIAVAGGKTPAPIFARLASLPMEWDRVSILPSDDRLVEPEDALSNIAMIKHAFSAVCANVAPLIPDAGLPYKRAGEVADAALQARNWPLDLVWLGMGNDGHTASLLPGPDLEDALVGPKTRRAVGVMPDPLPSEAPVPRVTLTGPAIAEARAVLLTITGNAKRDVLEGALREHMSSKTPIGRLFAMMSVPLLIRWHP